MRYIVLMSFTAAPAVAHDGLHLNPHGIELSALAMTLLLLAIPYLAFRWRRSR